MNRGWLVFASLVCFVPAARAGSPGADCNYLEIEASSGKAPQIDPELKPLEKKLTKRPFSSWNVFHKLSTGEFKLVQLKAEPLKLQKGAATLLLRDRVDKRLELTIAIDGSDGKRWLDTKQSVSVGDWPMWVHTIGEDGHILALTCK